MNNLSKNLQGGLRLGAPMNMTSFDYIRLLGYDGYKISYEVTTDFLSIDLAQIKTSLVNSSWSWVFEFVNVK